MMRLGVVWLRDRGLPSWRTTWSSSPRSINRRKKLHLPFSSPSGWLSRLTRSHCACRPANHRYSQHGSSSQAVGDDKDTSPFSTESRNKHCQKRLKTERNTLTEDCIRISQVTARGTVKMSFTTAVHLLALVAICDQVKSHRINFYNVKPPVEATPFPKSFKCFTCERAADNYTCNRWAEDKWCPPNSQFCMTVHHFTSHGKTKFVSKKCAAREECHTSGCRHHRDTGHTECVSCCEGMICNVEVPTNHTNAVFSMRQQAYSSAPSQTPVRTMCSCCWLKLLSTLGLGLTRLVLL
uniref:LY6/PLAUR domain containing 6B n=1 Tax=Salmo trutta TaxID=8032 RepID=A0A673X3L2_SALTR